MIRTPITRTPIQEVYCNCHSLKRIICNSNAHYLVCDEDVSARKLEDFVSTSEFCVPIIIYYSDPEFKTKLDILKRYQLSVVLHTSEAVPEDVLLSLCQLSHPTLRVSMDFLNDFPLDSLENHLERTKPLLDILTKAKAWKIGTGWSLGYLPVLTNKYHLYELLQMGRPVCSDLNVHFPKVSREDRESEAWSVLMGGYAEYVHNSYTGILSDEMYVKDDTMRTIIRDLKLYCSTRKISVDLLRLKGLPQETRHIPLENNGRVLGMKRFLYQKQESGKYAEVYKGDSLCPECNRRIV